MTTKQRLEQLRAAAARLDTKWPYGDALAGLHYVIYTQANAMRDDDMLILAELLHKRGAKVALLDTNGCQRQHNLRTIPCVCVDLEGVNYVKISVDRPEDVDLGAWLAPGGRLDPAVIRAAQKAAQDAKAAAKLAAEEERVHNESMRQLVLGTLAEDDSLSRTAKAFMVGALKLYPDADVAAAAREMMTALGDEPDAPATRDTKPE